MCKIFTLLYISEGHWKYCKQRLFVFLQCSLDFWQHCCMHSQLLNYIKQNKGILNFAFPHFNAKKLESVDFQWSHLFFQSEEIYRKGAQLKWHRALKGWEGTFAILIIYITIITKLQKSCPYPLIKNELFGPILKICCHSIKSLMVCVASAVILLIVFQDAAALSHDLKFFVYTESTSWSQWDLMSKYWRTLLISWGAKNSSAMCLGARLFCYCEQQLEQVGQESMLQSALSTTCRIALTAPVELQIGNSE